MFKWLKDRQIKEQKKLLYQNLSASAYLEGYFQEDRQILALIRRFSEENARIWKTIEPRELFLPDDTQTLLDINRSFRKFYDQTAGRYLKSFDQEFLPLLGWEEYYKRDL